MYELTVRTTNEGTTKMKFFNFEICLQMASSFLECEDVYAVEVTSIRTGELLYYKSKE